MSKTSKIILWLALPIAAAIIPGCSKNEVITKEKESGEIVYRTIETKAASSFDTAKKFYSYAYFLPRESAGWATHYASGTAYIANSLIEYVSAETAWKNTATKYYWPKQGSLNFFAWTDYTASPSVTGCTVSCAADKGITAAGYAVTSNVNKDFMVADIAADQKENSVAYDGWKIGVPTIFRHTLSNLVFTVKTDEETSGNAYPDGMFHLKSIKLTGVSTKGDYTQGSPAASAAPWSNQSTPGDLSVYSGNEISVTKTAQTLTPASGDYYIVLPQTFSSETPAIEIVYTQTTNYAGEELVITFTETKSLQDIYKSSWESGKKYTLNITLGASEVLWDPDTTDWTTAAGGEITI